MTVRETMDFSRQCLGTGARSAILSELEKTEKNAGIKPDIKIDAVMNATVVEGKETNVMMDHTLKVRVYCLLSFKRLKQHCLDSPTSACLVVYFNVRTGGCWRL
jgi:hypothetical protein